MLCGGLLVIMMQLEVVLRGFCCIFVLGCAVMGWHRSRWFVEGGVGGGGGWWVEGEGGGVVGGVGGGGGGGPDFTCIPILPRGSGGKSLRKVKVFTAARHVRLLSEAYTCRNTCALVKVHVHSPTPGLDLYHYTLMALFNDFTK